LTVGDDPNLSFSTFEIDTGFIGTNGTVAAASVSLSWSGNLFPNGSMPLTLPPVSSGSNPFMVVELGAIQTTYTSVSVSSCTPSTGQAALQLQTLETYEGPDPLSCNSAPLPQTSFSPSDPTVNVFLVVDGMSPTGGDTVALHWINPSNSWVWTSTWGATANTGASSRCFVVDLNVAQNIAPNWGQWQVGVFVNSNAVGSPSTFQVTGAPPPSIAPGGIVPIDGSASTIQSGEWVSIYGANLANTTASWNGDFPTLLGGTSVIINGKLAYLSFVSPGQINLLAPNDTDTHDVLVTVTTASGTATSTVTLAQFAPSFLLLDAKHVAGIIVRSDGSGIYSGGTYDIIGPTGTSLGYPTVAAKAGDTIELFGTGFGPTTPTVLAGAAFSGAAPTTNPVTVQINGVSVTTAFAGISGAGLYQLTLTVPSSLGKGDVSLVAAVGGVQTPSSVVISLQ
jgi:uncharacterized protein (TIGR03437 family)